MPIAHTDVLAKQILFATEAQYLVLLQLELHIALAARRKLDQNTAFR